MERTKLTTENTTQVAAPQGHRPSVYPPGTTAISEWGQGLALVCVQTIQYATRMTPCCLLMCSGAKGGTMRTNGVQK